MNIIGDKAYKCLRICTAYVETGRTIRSLAKQYNCSKTTIGRYLHDYAADLVDYSLYQSVKSRAKQNMKEVYYCGRSENAYSDELSSLD